MNGTRASAACVRSFGELELAVMDVAWGARRPLHPGEVRERLRPGHQLAYTTVLTVMTRLHAKGWLGRKKEGRGYGYWPTTSRAEYAAGLMSQALAVGGDDAATLTLFAQRLGRSDRQRMSR
jgi:predicted transcriptional regulator